MFQKLFRKQVNTDPSTAVVTSLLSILLCVLCLAGTTWAWFTATQTVPAQNIQTATYGVEVGIAPDVPAAQDVDPVYSLEKGPTYTVTLTPTGTAQRGYCLVTLGNKVYVAVTNRSVLSFSVEANEDTSLSVAAKWGDAPAEDQWEALGITGKLTNKQVIVQGDPAAKPAAGTFENGSTTMVIDEAGNVTIGGTELTEMVYRPDGNGGTLTGKLGSESVRLYQLNAEHYALWTTAQNAELYKYTVFSTTDAAAPVIEDNGPFAVYSNSALVGTYADLQSAVNAASSGDTIRITEDCYISSGAYIDKNLTIDGQYVIEPEEEGAKPEYASHILNRSKWPYPVLVVGENADVTVENLIIDGGADDFRVDFTLSYPAVTNSSLANEPRAKTSSVVSLGDITGKNLQLINHCTENGGEAALVIARGDAAFTHSVFSHNYGQSYGAAVYIGSAFTKDQKKQSVGDVLFTNCDFDDNYTKGGYGGAVVAINAVEVKFVGCDFNRNMAASYTAGGGAVLFSREGLSPTETNKLEYTKGIFENCLFKGNYSGNDGFAIQNECAELTISNTDFIGNVGLSGSSAVGTVSEMFYSDATFHSSITNCDFIGNKGACAGYGDHASRIILTMTGCTFSDNEGSMDILLYASDADISDCTFEEDKLTTCVLDIRAYSNAGDANYPPQVVELTNVTISSGAVPGTLVRRQGHDLARNYATLVIKGETATSIQILDATFLKIIGTLTGDVVLDELTPAANVTIEGTHVGTLTVPVVEDVVEETTAPEETTEPETTEPEATEPEATEPETTEPEATEPETTEPEATEPEATEPETTEPETTEPEVTEPVTTAPPAEEPAEPQEPVEEESQSDSSAPVEEPAE